MSHSAQMSSRMANQQICVVISDVPIIGNMWIHLGSTPQMKAEIRIPSAVASRSTFTRTRDAQRIIKSTTVMTWIPHPSSQSNSRWPRHRPRPICEVASKKNTFVGSTTSTPNETHDYSGYIICAGGEVRLPVWTRNAFCRSRVLQVEYPRSRMAMRIRRVLLWVCKCVMFIYT